MSALLRNSLKFVLSSCDTVCRRLISADMPHYAVAVGKKPGIYATWAECESQVKGFGGAKFKKFTTLTEAEDYITNNSNQIGGSSKNPNFTSSYNKFLENIKVPTNQSDVDSDSFISSSGIDKELNAVMDRIEGKNTQTNQNSRKRKAIMIDSMPHDSNKRFSHAASNKLEIFSGNTFSVDDEGFVNVYTDGSCTNNGTKLARAGLGVYFGEDHPLNISEPVSGRATNNCGEIQAATKAIKLAHEAGIKKLAINTDSQFLINSATKWLKGWKKKGWKLASGEAVKNEVDFKDLDSVLSLLKLKWTYVKAHEGILGNERADQLAKEGAEQYRSKR